MKVFRSGWLAAIVLVLGATALTAAQTGGQEMPSMKPGPEHEVLKMDQGTWDAVLEIMMGPPGAPPEKGKGVEVNTMGCGGRCIVTAFKAQIGTMPFEGHGVTTWDPAKQKYVGSWTDSMSTGLAVGESTYDAASKKWSGYIEGPDMTGKVVKTRSIVEWRGANTRVFTMYATGPDGKEVEGMRITYTRRGK